MLLALLQCQFLSQSISAQQTGDSAFNASVENPAYAIGQGPLVIIDEAHENFHTSTGRYLPFAELLRQDGYVVKSSDTEFTPASLKDADILVIANSLSAENVGNWRLPTPSAFTEAEMDAVQQWVQDGGALFLIADHMPFPGAAEALAERFGFFLSNGFALNADNSGLIKFDVSEGTLQNHPIVSGRNPSETVESVTSFTGQGFRIRQNAGIQPLMTLADSTVLLLPIVAWEFSDQTPALSAAGMLQGAVSKYGAGRVAMFGEAAMFTAQVAGDRPMGLNHPEAPQNAQFVLNVLHWLSGLLPDGGSG